MLRQPSRCRSVTRLLILALGVALLGSTLAPAPVRAQPPPPIPLPPLTRPSRPPIDVPPSQIPALPPNNVRPINDPPINVPPIGAPPLTAFSWGIHANGWHVCIRNSTDVTLRAARSSLTSNIAEMPDTVAPRSDNCTLRGQPSIYGGPANINFAYQVSEYSFPLNVRLVSWHPRGTSPRFDLTCDYHASVDVPKTCTVVRGTMREPIFVILEYAD